MLTLSLVAFGFSTSSTNASASSDSSLPPELHEEIDILKEKYNLDTFDLEDSARTLDTSSYLEFETVAEFEEFLLNLKNENSTIELDIEVPNNNDKAQTLSTIYKDSHVINWWAPIQNGTIVLASFKNVAIDYTYEFVNGKARFVDVTRYDSYLSGINDLNWIHRTGSRTFSTVTNTRDKANITVNGTYVLGVVIGKHPIGFSWNDTWTCSLTLTS